MQALIVWATPAPAAAAQAKFSFWVRWSLSRFFRPTIILCSLIHSSSRSPYGLVRFLYLRYSVVIIESLAVS